MADLRQRVVLDAQRRHPGFLGVRIGFDNRLAHLIEAGSDLFLMPSRFEPCGLNQMYSLRYGTAPIVRATGGLADTVRHTDETSIKDKTATGFVFADADAESLSAAINQALALWAKPRLLSSVRKQAMLQDFSWQTTAERYIQCYRQPAG